MQALSTRGGRAAIALLAGHGPSPAAGAVPRVGAGKSGIHRTDCVRTTRRASGSSGTVLLVAAVLLLPHQALETRKVAVERAGDALAESIIGLFKTEVIRRPGPSVR